MPATLSVAGPVTTGPDGRYAFTTVKPVSYTVPTDGPVGDLLNATGRHPWRPSHLHFIVKADGYRTLVSEIFAADDPQTRSVTIQVSGDPTSEAAESFRPMASEQHCEERDHDRSMAAVRRRISR